MKVKLHNKYLRTITWRGLGYLNSLHYALWFCKVYRVNQKNVDTFIKYFFKYTRSKLYYNCLSSCVVTMGRTAQLLSRGGTLKIVILLCTIYPVSTEMSNSPFRNICNHLIFDLRIPESVRLSKNLFRSK